MSFNEFRELYIKLSDEQKSIVANFLEDSQPESDSPETDCCIIQTNE